MSWNCQWYHSWIHFPFSCWPKPPTLHIAICILCLHIHTQEFFPAHACAAETRSRRRYITIWKRDVQCLSLSHYKVRRTFLWDTTTLNCFGSVRLEESCEEDFSLMNRLSSFAHFLPSLRLNQLWQNTHSEKTVHGSNVTTWDLTCFKYPNIQWDKNDLNFTLSVLNKSL